MTGLFVLSLLCLLSLTCFGHSSSKHMICKDVDDVFGDVTNVDVHTRRLIGPAGKKGSRGERGFSGAIGPPGKIDYDRVQEIVRLKVEEETRLLRVRVEQTETQIHNLTLQLLESRSLEEEESQTQQTTTQTIPVLQCDEGVIHEGRCFWAEVHSSDDINYTEAEEICFSKGSRLADIYGKDHYDLIMTYIRGKLDGRPDIWVWTGMRKIYGDSIARLSNGSKASYTHQTSRGPDWDNAQRSSTHVYLWVRPTNHTYEGMGAWLPTGNLHGALCQTE